MIAFCVCRCCFGSQQYKVVVLSPRSVVVCMHIEYICSVGTLRALQKKQTQNLSARPSKKGEKSEWARRRHPICKWKEMVYFFAHFSCVYRRSRQSMCTIGRVSVCVSVFPMLLLFHWALTTNRRRRIQATALGCYCWLCRRDDDDDDVWNTHIQSSMCIIIIIIIIPLMLQFSCYVFYSLLFYSFVCNFYVSCVSYPLCERCYLKLRAHQYTKCINKTKQKTDSPKAPVSHALSHIVNAVAGYCQKDEMQPKRKSNKKNITRRSNPPPLLAQALTV